MTAHSCRLYLITPPRIDDLDRFSDTLAEVLAAGDVAAVQVRLKEGEQSAPDGVVRATAERLTPVIQAAGVAALINDAPNMAQDVGADGVHLGQSDMPYPAARELLGPRAIIGVTCHNDRDLAMNAAEAGADYVAFGAFFETATKAPSARASLETLKWWAEIFTTPCVAIGGITAQNCAPLVQAGADFLAVSSAVWTHPDGPAVGLRALLDAITAARATP